ncbi:uncharacterized protein METZ01_LOCUS486039, partial [marine metagenome]
WNEPAWSLGYNRSRPSAKTAMVRPPFSKAVRWTTPSMPRANLLTTV